MSEKDEVKKNGCQEVERSANFSQPVKTVAIRNSIFLTTIFLTTAVWGKAALESSSESGVFFCACHFCDQRGVSPGRSMRS